MSAVPHPTPLPLDAPASPWTRALLSNLCLLGLLLLWPLAYFEKSESLAYVVRIVLLIGINVILATSLQLINGISGQFSLGHAGFMAVGAYAAGYATENWSLLPADGENGDRFTNPAGVLLFFVALMAVLCLIGLLIAGLLQIVRLSGRVNRRLPGIVGLGLVLWFVADLCVAANSAHPGILLVWHHLTTGLQKLFGAIGTHGLPAASWASNHLPGSWRKPMSLFVALAGGAAVAGAAGLLVGLPTLRLRGDYLAIATLGFGEIIRVAITNSEALGKATGLSVTPYSDPDRDTGEQFHYISRWIFAFAFLVPLLVWRLSRSPRGRAIAAVREDEIAAAAIGIHNTRQKVAAFVIGAALAGVGGAIFAHYDGYLNPNSFGFMRSVEIVVMVTLAGLGNVWWTVLSAALLTYLPEFLRTIGAKFGHPEVAEWRLIIYALLLIAVPISQALLIPRLKARLTAPTVG